MKDAVRWLGFLKGIWFMGVFDGNIDREGSFLIGANRQVCPTRSHVGRMVRFAPARGDDGNDLLFITRDFNRGLRKENGTIPFYGRFLKKSFYPQISRIDANYQGGKQEGVPRFQK